MDRSWHMVHVLYVDIFYIIVTVCKGTRNVVNTFEDVVIPIARDEEIY